MRNLYYKIATSFSMAIWAFKNPLVMQESNFKMLSDLLGLILKVAQEERPMMTHISYVHPLEGEKQIVSIWAGAGIGSSPIKRIEELKSENQILREKLSMKKVCPHCKSERCNMIYDDDGSYLNWNCQI